MKNTISKDTQGHKFNYGGIYNITSIWLRNIMVKINGRKSISWLVSYISKG